MQVLKFILTTAFITICTIVLLPLSFVILEIFFGYKLATLVMAAIIVICIFIWAFMRQKNKIKRLNFEL